MKLCVAILGLALAFPAVAQTERKPSLLIVGAPHFGNPGRDVVNVRVPDVLSPDRQREIEAVVDQLAAFRPTRVAVEWPAEEQARLDQRYADYRAGRHTLTANERDQIGLRLAARLGLSRSTPSTIAAIRPAKDPITIIRPGRRRTAAATHGAPTWRRSRRRRTSMRD